MFILPRMNVFGTRINTDRHGFYHAEKIAQRIRRKIREIREIRVGIKSIRGRKDNNPWESRVSEVIEYGAYLASGEILTVAVIASRFQLSLKRRVAVDPTHQMVGGDARVAVGKVEHGKLLFAVTSYFHT